MRDAFEQRVSDIDRGKESEQDEEGAMVRVMMRFVVNGKIDSAFPLTDPQVAELKGALEKRFGKKIEATVNVDPELVGGARITVGDTVIDASVRAQLQSMANQLRA